MVNMNAAGDKERGSDQNKNSGTNGDTKTGSTVGNRRHEASEIVSQRGNGRSSQPESDNRPTTNGAYPKTHAICNTRPECSGRVNGSSCSKSANVNGGESEKGLLRNCGNEVRPNRSCDRNSSSEDEECCVYTYRGDADLPSSFFRMDLRLPGRRGNSGNSSPEMDYLEMDFDPGPSNDRDSSDSEEEQEDQERFGEKRKRGNESTVRFVLSKQVEDRNKAPAAPFVSPPRVEESGNTYAVPFVSVQQLEERNNGSAALLGFPRRVEVRGMAPAEPFVLQREEARAISPTQISPLSTPSPTSLPVQQPAHQATRGLPGPSLSQPASPLSPVVRVLPSSASAEPICCCVAAKRSHSPSQLDENFNEGEGEGGTVIWKEQDALERQTSPIGLEESGATAVINALAALKVACCPGDVHREVGGGTPQPDSLAGFLLWRATAGATHRDVARALTAAQRPVCVRFFPTHPRRHVNLSGWLAHWIRQGAVPIVSVQRGSGWQHQMVSGVGPAGVALVGPRHHCTEAQLWPALATAPTIQVCRDQVLRRWQPDTSLRELADPSLPPAWRTLNVLGQVVGAVREGCRGVRSHITIPTSHESGITLAMLASNPACDSLRRAPQLPTHKALIQPTLRKYVTTPV